MNQKIYLLIILLGITLISNKVSAQESAIQQSQNFQSTTEFVITKDAGLTDFIVVYCDGKNKEELYKKTVEWISKNYNVPSEVIKAQVENDYIRFQGISKGKYCWTNLMTMCNDLRYEIEVSFKDGKYKLAVLGLEHNQVTGASGFRKWNKIDYKDSWTHFKKDGEVRKMYADNVKNIAGFFNGVSKELYDYIYNQNETAKSNEW